ncbi:MAG: flagellar assembly peptidoglycan hydrolase FlgJ [Pseudomonadota bacterium]
MNSLAQHLTPAVLDGVSSAAQSARVAANSGQALDADQTQAVIEQFEQMFVRMMLKSMRSATQTLSADGGLGGGGALGGSSGSNSSYLEMFDGQIAQRLVQGRGLGLAELLREQLGLGTPARGADPVAAKPLPAPRAFAEPAMPPPTDAKYQVVPRSGLRAPVGTTPGQASQVEPVAPAKSQGLGQAFESASEFVSSLLPLARQAARRLGVSARGLLSQMALETGWGRHVPPTANGSSSNNLFGIKAGTDWAGGRTTLSTLEMDDGVLRKTIAQFRVYDSPAQSLEDYVRLLERNPRYAEALGTGEDIGAFARGLQHGGYATDPAYAQKIESIANGKLSTLLDDLGVTP